MEIPFVLCYNEVNTTYRGVIMELGQRLKEARLEAGLSQRQLCGEMITRNMLSQIENGSARPSMDTLRYLAGVLKKPISFFLDEESASSNQQLMSSARNAFIGQHWTDVLDCLQAYSAPDPVFDAEFYLLGALTRLKLAEIAITENKNAYAQILLEQALAQGQQTPYYTDGLETLRLCLLYTARPDLAQELCKLLPADPGRSLLLAAANPDRAELILEAAPQDEPRWHQLRGDVYFRQGRYSKAREHYEQATPSRKVLEQLEECCRQLEDYKAAYEYACKLRV